MLKEINEQILKSHEFLSERNRLFLEYAQENTRCLSNSSFIDFKEGHFYSYINLNSWPTLISRETDNYFSSVSIEVFNLIKSIPSKIFNYDLKKMSEYYQIPKEQLEIIFWGLPNNQLANLLGRGDFILDLNNELKCIEYNVSASLGGWQIDSITKGYQNSSVINEYFTSNKIKIKEVNFFFNLYEHIRNIVKDLEMGLNDQILNIAYISDKFSVQEVNVNEQIDAIKEYFSRFKNAYNLEGCLFFRRYEELSNTNEGVFCMGTRIHCILEMDSGPSRFIHLVKNKKVITLNGTITVLMCNKLNLSVLSENMDNIVFSENEKEIIKKHIPWSRKLIDTETNYNGKLISLIDLVINNQEKFVLKKSIGFGGEDVFIGKNTSVEEWKGKIINAAGEKLWIVQEFIKPQEYVYQSGDNSAGLFEAVFGLFTLGSKYSNGFVRLLPVNNKSGVINSKQGACESAILVVE